MKNVEMTETGLKCDAEGCEWKDESIKFEDYEKWIDKPCPTCGANVLTQEDYNTAVFVHATVDFINSLSEEELKKFADNPTLLEGLKESGIVENPEVLDGPIDDLNHATIQTHKGIKIKFSSDEQGEETPVSES